MQVYTQYVNNFSASLNTLNAERKNSKAFNQFLISCEESNPMPLDALLSFPLNRIPYYRNVLNQILNATPRNGPDYKNMITVINDLNELQEYVSESKTQSDNMGKVFAIESRIVGREYPLNDLHRAFIKEGSLYLHVEKKPKKELYFFLFNDILVSTKKVQQKNQFRYKSSYVLQYAKASSGSGLHIDITNPTTNESLSLIASSQAIKDEWLDAITKTIVKMEKTRVYGVTLQELMDRLPEDVLIHPHINDLLNNVEKYGLDQPGIFRISGSSNTINSVINQVNRGIKVDLSKLDYHVISGLLKQFLRTMKEPVFPFSFFDRLTEIKASELETLKELINELPHHNAELLKRVIQLLTKVAKFSDVNKMTTSNLAIVIGPNLAREEVNTPMGEISLTTTVGPLVQVMIEKFDEIFPKEAPKFAKAVPKSAQVSTSARSSVLTMDGALMGARRLADCRSGTSAQMKQHITHGNSSGSFIGSSPRQNTQQQQTPQSPSPQPAQSPPAAPAPQPTPPSTPPVGSSPNSPAVPVERKRPPPPPPRRNTQTGLPQFNPRAAAPPTQSSPEKPEEKQQEQVAVEAAPIPPPIADVTPALPKGEATEETTACAKCGATISDEDEFIEALGKTWHNSCFTCSLCEGSLANGFFKRDGNPVCKSCRSKQRGNTIVNN